MNADPGFRVSTINATPRPNATVYAALHQDYSEEWVSELPDLDEARSGAMVIKRLLSGERGHFGPLEHPQITFGVGHFPHSVMQQARTHRVSVSFDVQSLRYTSQHVCDVAAGKRDISDVFYLRPVGEYHDRQGKRYTYSGMDMAGDLCLCWDAATRYVDMLADGKSEEHARGILPFDIRQHFVVSFNLRSLMHFLDLRGKADAQWEIQQLAALLMEQFKLWSPELAAWYHEHRWAKARLAP
jgi:thymidylate synthase (FAD)